MLTKYLNVRILVSIMLLVSTLITETSNNQQPETWNWKKPGIYNIPTLHANLTLLNNQLVLIGAEIPQEIKNMVSSGMSIQAVVIMQESPSTGCVLINRMDYPEGFLVEAQKKGLDWLVNTLKSSFLEGLSQGKRFQGHKVNFRWVNDPVFTKETQTIFFAIEFNIEEKIVVQTHAWILGKEFAIMFMYQMPKHECTIFKTQFESLVKDFKLDPEYTLSISIFDKKTTNYPIYRYMLLCYLIIVILIFIGAIIWRKYYKTKDQKIASEILLCFIITILTNPNLTQTHYVYWPFYIVRSITIIFFILFSWSWKPAYIESQAVRIVIKTLFTTMITAIGLSGLYTITNILLTGHLSIDHTLTLIYNATLGVFGIWRYKKIMPSPDKPFQDSI